MEPRIVIFLVLSLVIIFSYPYFLAQLTPPAQVHETKPEAKRIIEKESGANGPSERTVTDGGAAGEPPVSAIAPGEAETFMVIEGDLYRIVLSSRGGVLKEWRLKQYTKKDAKGVSQPIQLIPPSGKVAPLALTISGEDSLDNQTYSMDPTAVRLSKNRPTGLVVMKTTLPDGRSVTKELTFHNDRYQADLRIVTTGFQKGYQLALGSNFGITNWTNTMGGAVGAMSMINGKVVSDRPKMTTVTHESGATWVGLNDKYYMSAFLRGNGPRSARSPGEQAVPDGVGIVSVQGISEQEISASIQIPPPPSGNSREETFILYAGPKEYDRLAGYGKYLEESIDFGWFIYGSWLPVRLVAKPLFYILRFIHNITQNYGIAIILLTILVKVVFHPITKKSMVSMKQMAALQPKVEAIRKKWADNKEKMNKELIGLYKEGGVNPMGGCMPMLLQMPVFIALFNVLYISIELKEAPFMLWITDLSDKDPYYVLPVIMGGTMIIQQMTQPNTMDPTQAKIMMFMPVIYTFFFLSFPSGLVLYWLVNNLLGIAQQYWINKQSAVAR